MKVGSRVLEILKKEKEDGGVTENVSPSRRNCKRSSSIFAEAFALKIV